jgi:methanogenic corrinoid protein MtbC1
MTTPRRTTPREWMDQLEQTLEAFDETGGHRVLTQVFDELGVEDALSHVVLPYLQEVGERWSAGSIGVGQEHFASNVLRSRLSVLMATDERPEGPLAVLACMPGEQHEFGLMATSIVLSRLGWRTCYLGADTPTSELSLTCRTLQPEAVVVAARRATAFAAHAPALRRVGRTTPVHLAAAGATDDVAGLCHATRLDGDPVQGARLLHENLGGSASDIDESTAV